MTHAPSADAVLGSVVARILEGMAIPGLISAYLFGSHAEGRAHRESDVDVVMLNDAPPQLGRRIARSSCDATSTTWTGSDRASRDARRSNRIPRSTTTSSSHS